ncbi:MAG: response regulator [Bryobacteraceae bacterium]
MVSLLAPGSKSTIRTDAAADGFDALLKLRHGHWDLVFTDYAMPGMNGGELAHEIKRLTSQMPVILVLPNDRELTLGCAARFSRG